jgi:lipopolysaccharide biosynthesis glycosyltransferase
MFQQNNKIHLAIAFDQNFITPFYVLLTSIFFNNKGKALSFHVIAIKIDKKEKKKILHFIKENSAEIFFYEVDKNLVDRFVMPGKSHVSIATYYRLFFPSLVSDKVERLLYLDTDIVVIGDLLELYSIPMETFPLAASIDVIVSARPELGINNPQSSFNAGVLLINLREWRKQKISERTIQFLTENPHKIIFHDQDALNAVLISNWLKIDNRFNLTYFDIPINLPKRHFSSFLKDKVIIHYTTEHKPWLTLCRNRLRFLYHYYLTKSPLANKKKYTDLEWKNQLLYRYLKLRFKEFLIDHQNVFSKTTIQQ